MSKSTSIRKLHKKDWDPRFWKGGIPTYELEQDWHGEAIRLNSSYRAPGKLHKPRGLSLQKTPQQFNFSENDFNQLKEELESLWDSKFIPEPQRVVYRATIFALPRGKAIPVIKKEIENLRANRSPVQQVLRTIAAREESLKSLLEMNTYLKNSPGWEDLKEVKIECAELIHAHRMLTLATVEGIVKWRDQLVFSMVVSNKKTQVLPFIWQSTNYLAKMKTDLDFLPNSEFTKIMHIRDTADPLVLAPTDIPNGKKIKTLRNTYNVKENGQVSNSLPSVLLNRLKAAEHIILGQDAVFTSDKSRIAKVLDWLVDLSFDLKPIVLESFHEVLSEHIYEQLFDFIQFEQIAQEAMNDIVDNQEYEAAVLRLIDQTISIHAKVILDELKVDDEVSNNICQELVEDVIGNTIDEVVKEAKNSNSQNDKLAEMIYEELVDRNEYIDRIAKETLKELSDNEKLAHMICEEMTGKFDNLEGIVKECLQEFNEKDAVVQNLINTTYENILENHIDKSVKDVITDTLKEEMNLKITEEIYTSIEDTIIKNYAQEIVDDSMKESSEVSQILSESIKEHTIHELCRNIAEDCIKEQKENEKLSEQISESIQDDFLATEVNQIVNESIRNQKSSTEIDEIAESISDTIIDEHLSQMLPGEINDNKISAEISLEIIDEEIEYTVLEYYTEPDASEDDILERYNIELGTGLDLSDLSDAFFKPISIEKALIASILNEYYTFIPSELLPVMHSIENLISEAYSHNNPCWYWAVYKRKIIGLLVFSEDSLQTSSISIHHLSCLSFSGYKNIVQKAESFLWPQQKSLRFNFFAEDVPRELKGVFTSMRYKWKTNSYGKKGSIAVFGKDHEQATSQETHHHMHLQCHIVCTEDEITESKKIDEKIIKFANRACLLSALLRFFPSKDRLLPIDTLNRLQNEVSDNLTMIDATEGFTLPFVTQDELNSNESVSHLLLDFRWMGFTNMIYQPLNVPYQFLWFHSPNITHSLCESADIFMVPTSLPTIQAFFIVSPDIVLELRNDARNFRTDICYKAEGLLRSADMERTFIEELFVPAFCIEANGTVNWLHGFNIPAQGERDADLYVKNCSEQVQIECSASNEKEGILKHQPRRVIDRPFVYGIIDTDVIKVLEGPLFTALVQEKDWIPIK